MIWIESPTNPLLKIADIEAISKIAHSFSNEIIVVADNTFLSPFLQVENLFIFFLIRRSFKNHWIYKFVYVIGSPYFRRGYCVAFRYEIFEWT